MSGYLRANATDLAEWARRNDAKQRLPELIRRLCFATAIRPTKIEFASGEGTGLHGYDGVVETDGEDVHVPRGRSVWELSAEVKHRSKAEGDIKDRSNNPGPFVPEETVYIACTLRPWDRKEDTEGEWAKNYRWKRAKVYDCHTLEAWLQRAPAVHLWISRILDVQTLGAWDIDSYWDNWSHGTLPFIPVDLLLQGYQSQRDGLISNLERGERLIQVQGQSREFARAFVTAAISASNSDIGHQIKNRTVAVNTPEAWQWVTSEHSSLILIPAFDVSELIGSAEQRGHQVVLTSGQEDQAPGGIKLGFRPRAEIEPALTSMFTTDEERRTQAHRAAYTFSAFRRSIQKASAIPPWATPVNATDLIPAFCAGAWDDSYEGDRNRLAALAGDQYDKWLLRIRPWLTVEDAPLTQSGSIYRIADRRDAWTYLSVHLHDVQLEALQKQACEILTEHDRTFDLPVEDRWRAGIDLEKIGTSSVLRTGVADTVAILGAQGESFNQKGQLNPATVAHIVVRQVLAVSKEPKQLMSLSPYFSLLAEAAPDKFLTAIEGLIKDNPDAILGLFQDRGESFFSTSSPHIHVLWALETLAWDPEFFARSATVLARLSHIDPGGTIGNRPERSLHELFRLWSPHTLASSALRAQVLERLLLLTPEIAWKLILSLVPQGQEVSHSTSEPKYRSGGHLWSEQLTRQEVLQAVLDVSTLVVREAKDVPDRWRSILTRLGSFPLPARKDIIEKLKIVVDSWPSSERQTTWSQLRVFLIHHKRFANSDWTVQPEDLEGLQLILDTLESSETTEKWSWVFDRYVELDYDPEDNDGREDYFSKLREQAVRDVSTQHGQSGLLALVGIVEDPFRLGMVVGSTFPQPEEFTFLADLVSLESTNESLFGRGYMAGRNTVLGKSWIDGVVTFGLNTGQSVEFLAAAILILPWDLELLERLDTLPEKVGEIFWKHIGKGGGLLLKSDIAAIVVRKLVEYQCYYTAIDTLNFNNSLVDSGIDPNTALEVLERAVASQLLTGKEWSSLGHSVIHLMDLVDSAGGVDDNRLATLELIFAPMFSQQRPLRALNRKIGTDPEAFVQLLEAAYKNEDGDSIVTIHPEVEIPPMLAYEVLEALRDIPGQSGDHVDPQILRDWVVKGLEIARSSKRVRTFENKLGEWLANSPDGRDGLWPHEAVRAVLELLESPELESGLDIGVNNSGGVTWRAHDSGGDQERALVDKYRGLQEALAGWPRTARVMGMIADGYESHARWEDQRRG